jgi:hypothetical protein
MIGAALVILAFSATQTSTETDASAPEETPLAQAQSLVNRLRCDDAIVALEPLVAPEALARQERRHALFLLGYCLAVAGRGLDADERFRDAWGIDLDAAIGFDVEPNVQFLIGAAREAVVRAREEERRAAREAKRARVKLEATGPLRIAGGRRLPIAATLTDPQKLVTRLRFEFRRQHEKDSFTLPMRQDAEGVWRGEVAGLYTLTPDGPFTMAWRVVALDDEGELAESSVIEAPQSTYVSEDESLVPELRANERLPHAQRVLYASLGFGAAVVFTGLATAVTGSILAVGVASPAYASRKEETVDGVYVSGSDPWTTEEFFMKAIAAAAPLAATTGVAYAAMDPLIDGGWKILPPLIVFVSSLPSAGAALILDPSDTAYPFVVAGLGIGVGGAGTLLAAVTATVIVSLDSPNSIRDE